MDLTDAVYFESKLLKSDEISEIFVPIKTASGVDSLVHTTLLSIKDKETLSVFNELNNIQDDSKILSFMVENRSQIIRENIEIKGLTRNFMDRDDKDNEKLRQAYPTLKRGFVIVDEGEEPSKAQILCIPAAFVLLYFLLRKKKPIQV
ncbi:MAG: hypothetical protein P1U56_20995 [Saprospiraceae bacterium]|nr:hypothetical protein [Saprospiraceae bacterium]